MIYAKDDRAKRLLALVSTVSEIGRLTAGPPGIPPATLAVLREALMKAMSDADYIADGKKLGMPLDPAPGDKVEAMVKQAIAQPPELVADLKRAASE
jgi:tripartite-type tricarboxylate transporter receptor subunit TctC